MSSKEGLKSIFLTWRSRKPWRSQEQDGGAAVRAGAREASEEREKQTRRESSVHKFPRNEGRERAALRPQVPGRRRGVKPAYRRRRKPRTGLRAEERVRPRRTALEGEGDHTSEPELGGREGRPEGGGRGEVDKCVRWETKGVPFFTEEMEWRGQSKGQQFQRRRFFSGH